MRGKLAPINKVGTKTNKADQMNTSKKEYNLANN